MTATPSSRSSGHWGQVVLFYVDHTGILASSANLERPLADPHTYATLRGGYVFLDTSNRVARTFLERAPFTEEEKAAIGSGKWERLTGHVTASRARR